MRHGRENRIDTLKFHHETLYKKLKTNTASTCDTKVCLDAIFCIFQVYPWPCLYSPKLYSFDLCSAVFLLI